MVRNGVVLKLDEGKPVEGGLALGTPELNGLKVDEGLESKEDELLEFKGVDPKGGIG